MDIIPFDSSAPLQHGTHNTNGSDSNPNPNNTNNNTNNANTPNNHSHLNRISCEHLTDAIMKRYVCVWDCTCVGLYMGILCGIGD